MRRVRIIAVVLVLVAFVGLAAFRLSEHFKSGGPSARSFPAPVEVAPVERGAIELRRTFTGTIEARGRFVVAANVGGRVERLLVDLAAPVKQGQVVAELDDAEQTQSVVEASAELAVMRANLANAQSALVIAERELQRVQSLNQRGLVPDSDLDSAKSQHLARATGVEVAKAQLNQASAAQRRARIRSGYARVIAAWSGDDDTRVVAERHVAEGDTVAPNDPLITVVDLDPLMAVVHVTERDYGLVANEQHATLTTEAYPEKLFPAVIRRIAPVFRESSRQARMELEVPNPDGLLKPGMFVRAETVLDRVENATIVPLAALVTRDGKTGVFVVNEAGSQVKWQTVEVGIEQGDRVQVLGQGVEGRVVTLGQQLVGDGASITIPEPIADKPPGGP
jgi:RND family efflux transporter MFP subunit